MQTFLHTDSYQKFKDTQCLYLYGRRGTGKTSIIYMFNHEVNKGTISDYYGSYIIANEQTYTTLSSQLQGSYFSTISFYDLVQFVEGMWSWVITVSAMVSIYNNEIKFQVHRPFP